MNKAFYTALLATAFMPFAANAQDTAPVPTEPPQAESPATTGTPPEETTPPAGGEEPMGTEPAQTETTTEVPVEEGTTPPDGGAETTPPADTGAAPPPAGGEEPMDTMTEPPAEEPMGEESTGGMTDPAASEDATSTTTEPVETTTEPTETTTEPTEDTAAAAPEIEGPFVTVEPEGAWRTTDLEGKDVYDATGENIGSITDVLVSEEGDLLAVLVGVGGFLGIGQKDVAVAMSALEFGPTKTEGLPTEPVEPPAAPAGGAGGMTGTAPAPAAEPATPVVGEDNLPDRIVLNVTREELEAAPAYSDVEEGQAATDPAAADAGMGMTPAPQ